MSSISPPALEFPNNLGGPTEFDRLDLLAWSVVIVVFGFLDLTTTHLAVTATPLTEGNALAGYLLEAHGFWVLVALKFVGLAVLFSLYWVTQFRFIPYFLAVFGVAVVLHNAYRITLVSAEYTMWEATIGYVLTVLTALV